ncbi:hypothetical protein ACN42_g7223 [Penicillium freii]|uniref:Uncharacterized protein n=1 Tax=Penicillium freii TaxID=48697 RepID=A0A101MG03_PENFR|nr:hypothetical protein ACN42_g7223 [Penicillium freii]
MISRVTCGEVQPWRLPDPAITWYHSAVRYQRHLLAEEKKEKKKKKKKKKEKKRDERLRKMICSDSL